jgi:pentatricopeptide repeat protein
MAYDLELTYSLLHITWYPLHIRLTCPCKQAAAEVESITSGAPRRLEAEVLGRMQNAGVEPTQQTRNAILGEKARIGGVAACVAQWQRFEAEGWRPNVSSWNILLMAHAKAHDCSAAWATFADMQRSGCCPDEGTWVALITCHARKARARGHAMADARVMQVPTLMHDRGFQHTVKTGTALLDVLAQVSHRAHDSCTSAREEFLTLIDSKDFVLTRSRRRRSATGLLRACWPSAAAPAAQGFPPAKILDLCTDGKGFSLTRRCLCSWGCRRRPLRCWLSCASTV